MGGWAQDMTSLQILWIRWLCGVVSWATRENTSRTFPATLFCRLYITTAQRSPFSRHVPRCRLKCPELITSKALACAYAWKSSEESILFNLVLERQCSLLRKYKPGFFVRK